MENGHSATAIMMSVMRLGRRESQRRTLGWNMTLLDGVDQNTVTMLLGTDRKEDFGEAEPEHPDCLAVIWPGNDPDRLVSNKISLRLDSTIVQELAKAKWNGNANRLSQEHGVHWDVIDEVAEASWKAIGENRVVALPNLTVKETLGTVNDAGPSAGQIIHQRRSAVAFDGKTSISSSTLFHMMQRVMPNAERSQLERPVPWDVWPYDPAIHLMIFIHRVDGLSPGLYFLVRDNRKFSFIQQAMNSELSWTIAPGCPEGLPLYWLLDGDAKRLAAQVSCHQDIAGDSAFSFGMMAEFEGTLRERGAWWYPRMFWEAGLLGQVFYLEAEAAGVRATGIGCFFDDPVHEIVEDTGDEAAIPLSLYDWRTSGRWTIADLAAVSPFAAPIIINAGSRDRVITCLRSRRSREAQADGAL